MPIHKKKQYIGGQALIEGVMMKSAERVAFSARKDNKIVTKIVNWKSRSKEGLLSAPILRGATTVIETLILGTQALNWSAEQQGDEKTSSKLMVLTMIISFAIAFAVFVALPYWIASMTTNAGPTTFYFNTIDGLIRVGFFVIYIWIIGRWKDVRRIYQYHGAEHCAVHCYESGKPLTVKNCKEFSTIHPRCGTSLLIYVVGAGIILFPLIRTDIWYINLPIRLLLLPVIGGIGYEILRLSAKLPDSRIFWILSLPGRIVQKITTKRPYDDQIEVAITALKSVLK